MRNNLFLLFHLLVPQFQNPDMTVKPTLHKLHGFDLLNSGMTVKSGMQHFSSAEIHSNMEDESMTKKGDHIALFCLVTGNFCQ